MGDAKIVPIFVKKVCSTGILSLGGGVELVESEKGRKDKEKKNPLPVFFSYWGPESPGCASPVCASKGSVRNTRQTRPR